MVKSRNNEPGSLFPFREEGTPFFGYCNELFSPISFGGHWEAAHGKMNKNNIFCRIQV